jgi:hypothetical protein
VRRHAVDLVGLPGSESWQSTLVARIGNPYWLRDTHSSSPLRINTEVGGRGVLSTNQCEMSVKAGPRGGTSILSPTLCESPTSYSGIKCNRWCSSRIKCDGWCRYDLIPRVSVVSKHSAALCKQRIMTLRVGVLVREGRPAARLGRSTGITDSCLMRAP